MGKKIVFIIIIIVVAAVFIIHESNKINIKQPADGRHKIKVVTTLFPLYDFARNLGKDKAEVILLLPPGIEAHSFEPKPSDVVKINEADIFVYTGDLMEPWAGDILKSLKSNTLRVVDASKGIKLIAGTSVDADDHSVALDPHIWLDFDNAKIIVNSLEKAFEVKDPQNASLYRQGALEYEGRLTRLDSLFRKTLANCNDKEIVYGGHYAFGYLAKRYNLKFKAAQGVSPDSEPTARDLAGLVQQIRKENIKYIFYEELTSPKVAETISSETGTTMLLLNAAHNVSKDQLEKGVTFVDILEADLVNLKIGLGCK